MYNANLIVNSPMMAGNFRCKECHMNFESQHLLTKHKMKFCVGSTADPDGLQLRRGLRSTSPVRFASPDDRKVAFEDRPAEPKVSRPQMRGPVRMTKGEIIDAKLNQISKLKEQRSRGRDLRDLEERMLLDKLEDTDRQLQGGPARGSPRSRMPLSRYYDVRDLQVEYETLREKERSAVQQPVHVVQVVPSRTGRNSPYSRGSNSSMSIYLDDDYRRNPNQDQQLRSLAESHGRQMEYLQLRNRDLEKQREDIRNRLENLGRKTVVPVGAPDNTAELMKELRDQEMRSQRAMADLRQQMMDMNREPKVNVIEIEKPVYPQPVQALQPAAPPPPPPPEPKKNFIFPVYYGKSLVAEISAIRQAYLQNGGNDPDVLSQMAQMLAEAQTIEEEMNRKQEPKPHKEKPKDNMAQFNFLEMENERLHRELLLLQEQNRLAQDRQKNDKEGKKQSQAHKPYPKYTVPDKPPYVSKRKSDYRVPVYRSKVDNRDLGDSKYRPSYRPRYRPEPDARSYHSEPDRHAHPRERIIKYTAVHHADGTMSVERSHSHDQLYPRVPPLNLRDLSTPPGYRYSYKGKENTYPPPDYLHGYKKSSQYSDMNTSSKYKPRDHTDPNKISTHTYPARKMSAIGKLSHVSEGHESLHLSQPEGAVVQLPALPGQELQRSRKNSWHGNQDVVEQSRVPIDEPVGVDKGGSPTLHEEPEDADAVPIYQFEKRDTPPDMAWQVRRVSPEGPGVYSPQALDRQDSLASGPLKGSL